MYKILNQKTKKDKEEGQSMLEFVLALPVFLLILAIILDYGWLFYNQMGMENAARNAARVACVEYTDVCLAPPDNRAPYSVAEQVFKLDNIDLEAADDSADALTNEEKAILREVKHSMPGTLSNVEVTIKYTYDEDYINHKVDTYNVNNRCDGDVYVQVTALHKAISPLVGWGVSDGTTAMERIIKCQAVYKVEKNASI